MQDRNALLVKNSVALFVRMLLRLFVSVYTVRIILEALGVEDYGIYNVVAGFTLMFGFFNSSMSSAASRFMSYDIGAHTSQAQSIETFKIVATIQLCIIVFIIFVAETVGLWFVNCKLVIPGSRMMAANVVYQTSIVSMLFTVAQVPYNASIIAHENMSVYSWVEVAHSLMLLLVAYLILNVPSIDRLILYGILMMAVYVMTSLFYYFYCRSHYKECHRLGFVFKWTKVRPILFFSGWDLYANVGMSVHSQGMNVILNMIGTSVLNAAAGVGSQIYAALQMFSLSVTTAVRPQIIKAYAVSDYLRMSKLMGTGSKFLYLCTLMFGVPLIVKMDAVLSIWLVEVPDYAVTFARIILASQCIFASKSLFPIVIQATGAIRNYSVMTGTTYLLCIPLAYLLGVAGCSPVVVYATILIPIGLYVMISLFEIRKALRSQPDFSVRYLLVCFVKGNMGLFVSAIISIYIAQYFSMSLISTLSYCCIAAIVVFAICYIVVLGRIERMLIRSYAKRILHFSKIR